MSAADAVVPAIQLTGLVKEFAIPLRGLRLRAVDALSLSIAPGQVYGLLGPNGSGKSTTIKVLLGLLEPTAGSCRIFGVPCSDPRSRLQVGYLPEAPEFYRFLTGREFVHLCARICGVTRRQAESRVSEVLQWVGISEAADRRVGTYSKGMLQRIGLAQALVHDPRLVILDEPTAGVDPVGSAEIAELIARLKAQGKTILLSSHLLAQVEGMCDRIAILDRGRLILESDVASLVGDGVRRALLVEGFPPEAEDDFRTWLAMRGGRLLAIERPRTTLDQVFLEHVRGPDKTAEAGKRGSP